jgi:hypothetical protein
MSEKSGSKLVGVVCLRCGLRTPLQDSHHGQPSDGAIAEFHSPLFIIRCCECGKESSYLANEVVAFQTMPKAFSSAA